MKETVVSALKKFSGGLDKKSVIFSGLSVQKWKQNSLFGLLLQHGSKNIGGMEIVLL